MFFDAHADIWTDVVHYREQGITNRIRDFHYPRMRSAGMYCGIFTAWIDPPYDSRPHIRTAEILRHMAVELSETKDILAIIKKYDEIDGALSAKKLAVILGFEGLSGIGTDIEYLYVLYQLGFRHASLTWHEANALGTGVRGPHDRGLTDAGFQAVECMEHLGMLVDVSHANEKTFWDICKQAKKPLIASHSNCYAVCPHPRNLTDDQLRAIADRGGVVGVNSYSPFVHADPEKSHIDHVMDHIEHMVSVMGNDHISFGFDFGDFVSGETLAHFHEPETYSADGLRNVTQVPSFLDAMRARGFSEGQIVKFCHTNMFRVLKEILV